MKGYPHLNYTQVFPRDPDGLHMLGLALYGEGRLLRETSEGEDGTKGAWFVCSAIRGDLTKVDEAEVHMKLFFTFCVLLFCCILFLENVSSYMAERYFATAPMSLEI